MTPSSLYAVHHPTTGAPYLLTFDYTQAWDALYQSTATMCHPDEVFDETLAEVETFTTWDDIKFMIGESLTPEQTQCLYDNGYVYF